ncbi:uncharacterized protein [Pocillopora verrucosa]|uniref:uncharacterized protein n=1 Tax=Pocillopora verrucosa TaxID=203993 RepID=UPI00333F2584
MGKERKRKAKKTTSSTKKKGSSSEHNEKPLTDSLMSENGGETDLVKENQKVKGKARYSIKDLLKQAEECLDNFNYELAIKFCERALGIEPDNLEVLEMAGSVYLETGDMDKAKSCFENAVRISPDQGYSKFMNLGQLLEGQEAVAAFNKGIQLMIASKDNDTAQASASDSTVASSTEISTAYCSLAEMYLTDECFKEEADSKCYECCQKAVEFDATNPEAYQLMASCLLSQQNMEEARKMLDKSLELWQGKDEELPEAPVPPYETRITTSKLLIELENYETAGSVLEELIEESDEVPQVWYLLGWLNHITNQDSTSIRTCLEQAQKLFTQFGCDDQPMMDHVTEMLASLPEVENPDEENGGHEEDSDPDDGEEEEMDTQ